MKLSPKSRQANFLISMVLLLSVVWIFWDEFDRSWKSYQHEFNRIEAQLTVAELAELQATPDSDGKQKKVKLLNKRLEKTQTMMPKINQLWLTDFGITDRCVTCHQGVELDRFAEAPQPFTKHPGEHLAPNRHPVDQFGCVICHDGQGVALTVESAHGHDENWLLPLLEGKYAEASCTTCHPMGTGVPLEAKLKDAPLFSKGRTLYLESNCLGCHNLSGFERPERIGPNLTRIALKTSAPWMKYWIKEPKKYLAKTVMPNFGLQAEEIEAITAYLLDLEAVAPGFEGTALTDTESLKQGRQTLENLGCLGCHTINGTGGDFGPDLSRIGEKAAPSWLTAWIKDPKAYWFQTAMPKLRATDEEIKLISAYLASLRGPEPVKASASQQGVDSELLNKGRLLVKDKGCTGCHAIGKMFMGFNAPEHLVKAVEEPRPGSITGMPLGFNAPEHNGVGGKRVDELVFGDTTIPHTLRDWLHTKVKTPRVFATKDIPTLMPEFGFSDDDAKALVTFLLSQSSRMVPPQYVKPLQEPGAVDNQGELLLEKYNCLGCHRIGERGGDIGPDLTIEGERVNPEWLVEFLQAPVKIRPAGVLPTRMPTFGLSDVEAQTIAAYFAQRNTTTYPYYVADEIMPVQKDRDEAWKMYWQIFSCQTCHSWNGQGGKVGPDQSNMAGRLRKEWIMKWLKDPQKIIADVRMPNFEFYDDELLLFSDLLMSFTDVPPSVWDQLRRRWEDEQLAKKAAQQGGN